MRKRRAVTRTIGFCGYHNDPSRREHAYLSDCIECKRAWFATKERKRRAANRQQYNAAAKAWRHSKPEPWKAARRAQARAYRYAHIERFRANDAAYRVTNGERIKERMRIYNFRKRYGAWSEVALALLALRTEIITNPIHAECPEVAAKQKKRKLYYEKKKHPYCQELERSALGNP